MRWSYCGFRRGVAHVSMAVSTFGSATLKSQVSNEEEMNCGEEQSCARAGLKKCFSCSILFVVFAMGFPFKLLDVTSLRTVEYLQYTIWYLLNHLE